MEEKIPIPTAKVQEIYITDKELLEAYENLKDRRPVFGTVYSKWLFTAVQG